ncbi:KTSC domain-containing protein [Nostoc sp. CHAB 5824]|nr:KTSC domain-containing protein [Nostoc sp. CHAB 5824]
MFEVQLVNSTAIRLIAFRQDGTLRIVFRSGTAYDYSGVERSVFDELCDVESVGSRFQSIRNAYTHQRLSNSTTQDFLFAVLQANTGSRLMVPAA